MSSPARDEDDEVRQRAFGGATANPRLERDARYDHFGDWYVGWVGQSPGVVCDPELALVPVALGGQLWLDVACGQGRTSRELARRGAEVVGIDLSPELIARAKEPETAESTHVDYVVGDIGAPGHWWDGRPFDGALCEMALMDIDDHGGTFRAVAEVLQPGAPFLASLVHPCFPGNEAGLSSWPPERGYFAEGFWSSSRHNPDGVRIRVGSNHRTVSTYINAAIDAGLVLERVIEPSGPVPMLLILACRRR